MSEAIQFDLYQTPASHYGDPETSIQAEKTAPIKGQALEVYQELKKCGPCTMYELAGRSGIDYYVCQRRISVLERNHLAKPIDTKPNPVTGKENQVWQAI